MLRISDISSSIHVLIDSIQSKGDQSDYYKINHIPTEEYERIARVFAVWLALQKIDIDYNS